MSNPAETATLSRLTIPLLLNSMMGLVTTLLDTLIISMHSESSAAAVSLANQILVVAYDLSVLMGVGGTILIAHALGRNQLQKSRYIANVAIVSNTLLGVLIGLVMFAMAPWLVKWINAPAQVADETLQYIRIISVAIPFNGFLMASVASLRGFSQARAIFLLGIFAFPSYLFLDYALVLGLGWIPSLGVEGSALATLFVRVGSVVVLLFMLPRLIGLRWRFTWVSRSVKRLVARLTSLSAPSVLDNVAYGFYQIVLLSFVAGFGVVAVVSRFYALALSAFLAVVVMAISQANEVLVGYRHGKGKIDEVHSLAWRSGAWSAVLATVCSVVLYVWSAPLVRLFSDDPDVLRLTQQLLFLTIFIQPLTGLNTVLFHSLRVTGDVRIPVMFSQVVMWCMAVPLAYWFVAIKGMGVAGLWYAMIAEELAKTLFMVFRWRKSAMGSGTFVALKAE